MPVSRLQIELDQLEDEATLKIMAVVTSELSLLFFLFLFSVPSFYAFRPATDQLSKT